MTKRHHVPLSAIGKQARIVTPALVEQGRAKVRKTRRTEKDYKPPIGGKYVQTAIIYVVGKMIDMNQYSRNKGSRIRGLEDSKQRCKLGWLEAGKPIIRSPYRVRLKITSADRKHDFSNLYSGAIKAFLDAMTDVGCVVNDSRKHHVGPDSFIIADGPGDLYEFVIDSYAESF